MFRRVSWFVGVFCLILLFSTDVWAYLLPFKHHLRQISKKRGKIRTLEIKQKTTVFWKQRQKTTYDERILIKIPGLIRRERRVKGKLTLIEIFKPQSAKRWTVGEGVKSFQRVPRPSLDLFAMSQTGAGISGFEGLFSALKIQTKGRDERFSYARYQPQKYVGLGWFKNGSVLIIGASKGNEKKKLQQVWFDRKNYQPIRFLGRSRKGMAWLDIRFYDYFRGSSGATYPGRVEEYREQRLFKRSIVTEVKANNSISKTLFEKLP